MRQFPVVRASGTNYEVGLAIGREMREAIADLLEKNKKLFGKNFTSYLEKSEVFLDQVQTYFPQYLKELQGIADAARVPFDELFLSNNREVADYDPRLWSSNHCTIIGIPYQHGYLLGHNEDWDPSSLRHLYVLDAVTNGTKIFGLNYANCVVGDSMVANGYGLVQAINELSHQDAQLGVPKNFIARAILDCQTLEEAEKLMKTVPRAAGFNHVLVQGRRLWNIESSAKEFAVEKIDHQKYVHTNHYLTELKQIDRGNAESEKRYQKVKNLLPSINAIKDIKDLLSDRIEPYICRDNTIGSIIFDTVGSIAHIAYGQPTPTSYYQISL